MDQCRGTRRFTAVGALNQGDDVTTALAIQETSKGDGNECRRKENEVAHDDMAYNLSGTRPIGSSNR
jgi:hypothetical protein